MLEAIGLAKVKDTFVGNAKVRGVSGGQRKRVTVGEMMCVSSQVQMFDEISTGLDGKKLLPHFSAPRHFDYHYTNHVS